MAQRSNAGGAKKRPTRYGSNTSPALRAALSHHKKGQWSDAERGYLQTLAHDPESVDAWMNLAAVHVMLGRAHAAEGAFVRGLELGKSDARVARDAGIGLLAIGQSEKAKVAFERALSLEPELVGARLCLSRLCAELGEREAARLHAERATADAPHEAATHLELHRAVFDDRALEPAIAKAARALELDPTYALASFFLRGARRLAGQAPSVDDAACTIAAARLDALDYALAQRGPTTRYFANRFDTLCFALGCAELEGPVLELGVRFGVSTRVLAAHAERVIAFDSFQGLPDAFCGLAPGAFSTAGEPPELPSNVELHVGWFEHTLPAFSAQLERAPRLIHIDSDLYASAVTALTQLGPHVRRGTVLVFDEYLGNESWRQDEHRALKEASVQFGWRYEYLAFSWVTGQAVVRIG